MDSGVLTSPIGDADYVEVTNVVGQVSSGNNEAHNDSRGVLEGLSMDAALERLNKLANGLFSANLLEALDKCDNLDTRVREGMAIRKSADAVDTVITIYNLLSANNEYLNTMRKIKLVLGEDNFKLLLGEEFETLDPDSENKVLYNRKMALDITKALTSLVYLISEQVVPNEYVSLVSSFLYILINTAPEISQKYRGVTKDVEKQNDLMKTFFDKLKKDLKEMGSGDIEQGNSSAFVIEDNKEKILDLLTSKCDRCYLAFDSIKQLDPVRILMDNMSVIGLAWSSALAAHDVNNFISERDKSTGCEEHFFQARKNASAAAIGIMIPEYALLSLKYTYGFIRNTTELVTKYGKSTNKDVIVNMLSSLNSLVGAASSAFACYTLYNTAVEPEEETMKKILIANAFVVLAGFVESVNKRNNLFSGICDAGHSTFTWLSDCCSSMCSGITSVFGNKKSEALGQPLLQHLPEAEISNPENNKGDKLAERSWASRVETQSSIQRDGR